MSATKKEQQAFNDYDYARDDPERSHIEGMPALGRSTAWYDGSTLVIDTVDFASGYVSTMAEWAGMPQSVRMRTVERIGRDGDVLTIETTHQDPAYYREWLVEMGSYNAMLRSGFQWQRYVVGDSVTITGWPGRRDRVVFLNRAVLGDGTEILCITSRCLPAEDLEGP